MPKLGTDAFLYLNPEPGVADFAQCSTCRDWLQDEDRCFIHGPHVRVTGEMSCGLYVYGEPSTGMRSYPTVSPTESGLVDREVRCENCKWGGPDNYTCQLYVELNAKLPDIFELDTDIDPKGCCNAQQPREA